MGNKNVLFNLFFGWEDVLRGEMLMNILTLIIKHEDKVILYPRVIAFTKDTVGDIVDIITFATNSCGDIKELYFRSGKLMKP